MEVWEPELRRMIDRRKKSILLFNPDRVNRRFEDSMGCEVYSKNLEQLFPPTDPYSYVCYPSKEDLCIVFHDERKIIADENVMSRINILNKRFIWIEAVK